MQATDPNFHYAVARGPRLVPHLILAIQFLEVCQKIPTMRASAHNRTKPYEHQYGVHSPDGTD